MSSNKTITLKVVIKLKLGWCKVSAVIKQIRIVIVKETQPQIFENMCNKIIMVKKTLKEPKTPLEFNQQMHQTSFKVTMKHYAITSHFLTFA